VTDTAIKVAFGILERYGWQALAVVVSMAALVAIYLLVQRVLGQTTRIVDVLVGLEHAIADQGLRIGDRMEEVAKMQAVHTEVARTGIQEIKGLAEGLRQSDRERSRDMLDLAKTLMHPPVTPPPLPAAPAPGDRRKAR
jgi:hypothetical protein